MTGDGSEQFEVSEVITFHSSIFKINLGSGIFSTNVTFTVVQITSGWILGAILAIIGLEQVTGVGCIKGLGEKINKSK